MESLEYSATQIRRILHGLFPQRRLVLSQFTFFNHAGVSRATGSTFRRGRRCYRLPDILPIACILALKEEGIPYKNVESLPALIQENADRILEIGDGCRLSGFGSTVNLKFPDQVGTPPALESFLEADSQAIIFWSFNIGLLAQQLRDVAEKKEDVAEERQAA